MPTVRLLAHTPDPETLVAAAAKLCYSSSDAATLMDGLTPKKTEDFINMLSEIGHESPIEHISFTFAIEGVSRSFLAQITRHRLASYSVQSQRYVKKDQFDYIMPPAIEQNEEAKKLFLESMNTIEESYRKLAALLTEQQLTDIADPTPEQRKAAEKTAIEDARFVLPNACDTKMVVTMNARSLLNFFKLRCCNRAQWEIREVARQMLMLVREVAPHIFAKAGPSCLRGACPEGAKSCGKITEVRKLYRVKSADEK
ncbi:MAG: FAD-dependent thymidylate synthase [Ruminococcaceae bacterium]|nr:FAD-dependent thymidylate synthase [Oscillospiraceae bacterium]